MRVAVSIIVPAHNSRAVIGRCLDSIIPQMDESMELIVVDDGSTDGTFDELRNSYGSSSSVRLVRMNVNRGSAYARNTGILLSRGNMVAFCDADDEWLPGKLSAQMASLESDPDLDFVFTYDDNVTDDSSPETLKVYGMASSDKKYHFRTGLFRRVVFDKVGLMDESLRQREDTEWVVRAFSSSCRHKVIEVPYYSRHISSGGISATAASKRKDRSKSLMDVFLRGVRRKSFINDSDVELSVLIPCMNASRYIGEAIASCASRRKTEIIIVDDGSTDDSVNMALKALEISGFQGTVVSRAHSGQAASRNDALAVARGEWIIYLDADDYFTDGAIDTMMEMADSAEEDIHMLSFQCKDFVSPELTAEQASKLVINPAPYRRMLAGCMLARKSLYDRIGGFNESLPSSETADWVLRLRDSKLGVLDSDYVSLARRYHMNNFGRAARATQMSSYLSIIRSRMKGDGRG